MTMQTKLFPLAVCFVILSAITSSAQTTERRQPNSPPAPQEQPSTLPLNANSMDVVANEIGLLRKSVQTLNVRLREISDKVLAPDSNPGAPKDKNKISLSLELLAQAEQRAEIMRKQLFELIEKETLYKSRLVQIEEDMRPETIERAMNGVGTTRTFEVREVRRRVLENDKRGFESLLSLTTQSRIRLDEDVKQADLLVSKLRQRIFPLIDKEIEKINPN